MKKLLSILLILATVAVSLAVGTAAAEKETDGTVVITDDYSWTLDNAEAGTSTEVIGVEPDAVVGTYEITSQTTVPNGYIGIYT